MGLMMKHCTIHCVALVFHLLSSKCFVTECTLPSHVPGVMAKMSLQSRFLCVFLPTHVAHKWFHVLVTPHVYTKTVQPVTAELTHGTDEILTSPVDHVMILEEREKYTIGK